MGHCSSYVLRCEALTFLTGNSFGTIIAVHAGLEEGPSIASQIERLERKDVTHHRLLPLSGHEEVIHPPNEVIVCVSTTLTSHNLGFRYNSGERTPSYASRWRDLFQAPSCHCRHLWRVCREAIKCRGLPLEDGAQRLTVTSVAIKS